MKEKLSTQGNCSANVVSNLSGGQGVREEGMGVSPNQGLSVPEDGGPAWSLDPG